MRKILRDFYFGNLTPSERQMTHNSNLMRAAAKVSRYEDACGCFEMADGFTLMRYLEADEFARWNGNLYPVPLAKGQGSGRWTSPPRHIGNLSGGFIQRCWSGWGSA